MRKVCLPAFLLLVATPTEAIVRRHDRNPNLYVAPDSQFPAVGHLGAQVACTLIAPRWALGAAHTIEDHFNPARPPFVLFAGKRYRVDKVILHPRRVRGDIDSAADLALLRLATPVEGIVPLPLYERGDEPGKIATLVGRGESGTGLAPEREPRGQLRFARNKVEAVFQDSLVFVFDTPPAGEQLEGAGGAGDSGGPALLEQDGSLYLTGVASFNSGDAGTSAAYGTIDAFARISTHRQWILDTMAQDPPSSIPIFGPYVRAASVAALPRTPAARATAALLAAFNSARIDQLADFYRAYGRRRSEAEIEIEAGGWQELFDTYGRYEMLGYTEAGPLAFALFVRATKGNVARGVAVVLDPEGEHRVQTIVMGDSEPPDGPP